MKFVTTGSVGAVCAATLIGVGAWVGTTGGGIAGELVGEKLFGGSPP